MVKAMSEFESILSISYKIKEAGELSKGGLDAVP